jgi:hypothetical protein
MNEREESVDYVALRQHQQDMLAHQYDRWMAKLPKIPDSPIAFYDKVVVDEYMAVSVGEWGGYLIQITSMGFNNRIALSPLGMHVYDWGWCYDRGPTALMALLIWNPETEGEPPGYKKVAGAGGRQPGQKAGPLTQNALTGLALIAAFDGLSAGEDEP